MPPTITKSQPTKVHTVALRPLSVPRRRSDFCRWQKVRLPQIILLVVRCRRVLPSPAALNGSRAELPPDGIDGTIEGPVLFPTLIVEEIALNCGITAQFSHADAEQPDR